MQHVSTAAITCNYVSVYQFRVFRLALRIREHPRNLICERHFQREHPRRLSVKSSRAPCTKSDACGLSCESLDLAEAPNRRPAP